MKFVIESQFDFPRLPIDIATLPVDYEANAMRGLLEMMGCTVGIHWIGTPMDFLRVLGQEDTAPRYLLIAGHGDPERGFYFGEYAEFIDTSMLREQYMPAEALAPVVNLPGCTVISSACGSGAAAMGRAFTQQGRLNAYIGCRVYPEGTDMSAFLVNFFHNVLRKKLTDQEAWQKAMLATDQPAIYEMSFFHGSGVEERYQPG